MPEKFEHENPEEALKDEVLDEMREFHGMEVPMAQEDWDLVWVLSGPPTDIAKVPTKKEKNKSETRNESRTRLETAFRVAREVTAKRTGKNIQDVTAEDIKERGPKIFWNATDRANDNLRQRVEEGFLEDYDFPQENLIISQNLDLQHTGHQFEKFPAELANESRKIVLVTDIYHLPRAKRYLGAGYDGIPKEKVILYPSDPRKVPYDSARTEIDKIPDYIEEGILPPEEQK